MKLKELKHSKEIEFTEIESLAIGYVGYIVILSMGSLEGCSYYL